MNKFENKGSAGHFDECHVQLTLLDVTPVYRTKTVHDSYWDEITKKSAPEHIGDKWNPDDFGEPPEPDDFNSIEEFEKAWSTWEGVREQVKNITQQPAPEHLDRNEGSALLQNSIPSQEGVREQSKHYKPAPEHLDRNEGSALTQNVIPFREGVREQNLPPANINQNPQGKQKPECKQDTHWVETYWVKSGHKKHFYYRYCWMIGRKICKFHLGSVLSNDGKLRRREVLELIDAGATPTKIVEYVKKSNNSRN